MTVLQTSQTVKLQSDCSCKSIDRDRNKLLATKCLYRCQILFDSSFKQHRRASLHVVVGRCALDAEQRNIASSADATFPGVFVVIHFQKFTVFTLVKMVAECDTS